MVRVNANVICGLKSPLNNISVGKAEQISMWIQTDDFGHRCYIDVSSSSNANWTIIAIIPKIIEPPLFPAQIVKSRWKLARINRRTAEEQDSSEDLKAHTWRKVKWLHCCGLIFTYINVETRRRMLAGCMVGWLASNNMALAAVLWSLPKYSTEQPPNSWSWWLRKKPVPSASWPPHRPATVHDPSSASTSTAFRSDGNCLAAGFRLRLTCFKSASQAVSLCSLWFGFGFGFGFVPFTYMPMPGSGDISSFSLGYLGVYIVRHTYERDVCAV